MPVLQNGDEYSRHDNEDYSFVTRSDRSRDHARRRRYGNEDEDDHVMSQVSLPLRLSRLGTSSRRSYTPIEDYSPPRRSAVIQASSPYSERGSRLSGPVRQALALCGKLDNDNAYYPVHSTMTSPQQYDDIDDDEEYVIVMQRRRKRHPMKRVIREENYALETPRTPRHPSLYEDDDEESVFLRQEQQRPRKREYDDEAAISYTTPMSRKRHDAILEEEQPIIREVASYVATRKKFAVEDDDVMQKLKNQKYQYRTRGPNRFPSDTDEDLNDRKGSYAQAPMIVMKLRSHVVWEKMYVKFTCTIRGTPDPKVTWYHNLIAIEPATLQPGTMRISSQFGVHTLEIFQARLEDSGTYRVSAQNHKGEISSYATLVVRRYDGVKSGYYDCKTGYNLTRPTDFPDVETLDVPDIPSQEAEAGQNEDDLSLNQKDERVLYCGTSVEVGDGKFESVLEFRVPGNNQPLEEKKVSLNVQESTTLPTSIVEDYEEDTDENNDTKTGKSFSQSLSEASSDAKADQEALFADVANSGGTLEQRVGEVSEDGEAAVEENAQEIVVENPNQTDVGSTTDS